MVLGVVGGRKGVLEGRLLEVTCKDSKLQQSLKDVIDKWHKDKGKTQNPQKDWDQVWMEILQMIEPLSNYISTYKSSVEETYCKNPSGQGTKWTEADRNACMLITAGLKHIYEIKEDPGKEGDVAKKNDRIFRQTAACIILNELIRKLQEKANSCTQVITIEEGIKHAFSVSSQIKNSVCANDNDCIMCIQEDYSNCTMNKEQVGNKLKAKFDNDAEIKKALEDIYPPANPSSTSGTATIRGWFTRFSEDVTGKDEQQYDELEHMLELCNDDGEDNGFNGKVDLKEYKEFCKIMVKNIILTTGVPKEYKNKGGQTPCEKKVKNIPVCDLLKVWMYYMHIFCVPEAVIKHFLDAVKQVRDGFKRGLIKDYKYVECAYDAAFKIPVGDRRYMESEAYEVFSKSTLYEKIKALTNKKAWCKEAPKRPSPGRADQEKEDQVISGEFENLKNLFTKIDEKFQEEEEPQKQDEEDPPREEDPPGEEGELDDVVEDDEEEEEAESEAASKDPDQAEDTDAQDPEVPDAQVTEKDSEKEATQEVKPALPEDDSREAPSYSGSSSSSSSADPGAGKLGGSLPGAPVTTTASARTDKMDNPVLPYLPLTPAVLCISIMSYLLWKYFGMLRKTRKRYRRAHQVRGPSLEQQIVDHVDQDRPHAYTLVKKRKPRSTPIKRRKKQGVGRRPVGRRGGVRRRMIIDIHLEVLNECQMGDTKLVQEDFFEILVQEFMGSKFMEEENVPKEQVQS
ncbi:SICA antigen [Plasmodium coatneyi]|uniref:SICA antigen n=1 Tax=Plasmodium coatneyi TaxID=208452 RepID=A0A1B1DSP2_9APIC|nr:SICA antigen [Plasmodium coatneyi]ANQ05803.1 SICA antigen [Plasmodium coatneyi]